MEWKFHDDRTGLLYFCAGVACWQRSEEFAGEWIVRVDVAFQPPQLYRCDSEACAQQTAIEMAWSIEESILKFDVVSRRGGRTMHGALATVGEQKHEHSEAERHRSQIRC